MTMYWMSAEFVVAREKILSGVAMMAARISQQDDAVVQEMC